MKKFTKKDVIERFEKAMHGGQEQNVGDFEQVKLKIQELAQKNRTAGS